MLLGANPLIEVNPGLMIWTIVCFLVVLFVLKKFAFGPVQQMIDTRRERIQNALDEADRARAEARNLLEEHRKLIGQAKSESEEILAEARRVATRSVSGSAPRPRKTASAGSRRRAARSSRRRSRRSARSARRSASSASSPPRRSRASR